MGLFKNIGKVYKKFIDVTTLKSDKPVVAGVAPFAVAAPVAAAGIARSAGIAGKIIKSGVDVVKRQLTNPFAGVSVKQGLTTVGKRIAGYSLTGGLFGAAYTGAKSLTTGDPLSLRSVIRGFSHGLTFGVNPFGAVSGTAVGLGEKYGEKAKDFVMPPVPEIPPYNFPSPNTNITSEAPTINISQPSQTPLFLPSSGSGFSPSVSVGGSDNLPLLLLLLGGAGAGAYLLGRRKRKKKYKKRKRR